MSKGLKPTIRDVATAAGVSLTTVSYVLSGRHGGTTRISQPTQDRVLSAVKELGYVPNQAARGMRRGKTDVVAVAIGNLEWPWDRALATAAANILPERGYQPVILLGEDWRKFMMSGGADGVIIGYFPEAKTEDETVTELARRGVAQVVAHLRTQRTFDQRLLERLRGVLHRLGRHRTLDQLVKQLLWYLGQYRRLRGSVGLLHLPAWLWHT